MAEVIRGRGRAQAEAEPITGHVDAVAARAAAEPGRVALAVDGGDELTYGTWEGRSNSIARGLAARGVAAGDPVALLFEGREWVDFAVAYLSVLKAGAVAALLSPATAPAGLARTLSHSGAAGLLCGSRLTPPSGPVWAAHPDEVGRGHETGPLVPPVEAATSGPVELVYLPAPLAPPRPWARTHDHLAWDGDGDGDGDGGTVADGWLVHTWAPGTLAGQHAMGSVAAGRCAGAVWVAALDPHRLCALLAERRAAACGLTPGLAAALVASGAPARADMSSVTRLLLSGPPSAAVLDGLRAAFPLARVSEMAGHVPLLPPAVSDDDPPAPVAVSQEGMLWHEQFTPGSFNLPCLVRRYQGPLDVAALEWAFSEMVRRHQPLRTTFEVISGQPQQIVRSHRAVPLAVVDLAPLSPGERDAEAARLLAEATGRPFDLAAGPLFEPRLVRLGPDDHLLVVRLHHTVFDDWSVDVFRRELSALYTARLAGAPSPLVEPPTSFVDFCRRQRARLEGEQGAAHRTWWRQELSGAPLAVQLPIGHGAAVGGGGHPEPGEPLRLDLPSSLAEELRALAPRLRATPFMTVLAAFSVLLARSTGLDDLVIATVVAHRDESDLEPLVGCFTKKIPLRLRVGGDPTFPELVARTRGSLLGALSHQAVAFDAAVQEALGTPAADHGVVPQVTVVFQGETPQQVRLALPGLKISRFETRGEARRERHFSSGPEKAVDEVDAPVWGDGIYLGTFLILSLLDTSEGMALVARGVFHRPAAQSLLEAFRSLLADVAADPSRRLSELAAGDPSPVRGSTSSDDVVELRGFRVPRSRLEAALAQCPGVAEVGVAVRNEPGGEPRLIAYVVPDGHPPPTLAQLRHALWASLPGVLWPADAVVVDALARLPDGRLDPAALPPAPPWRAADRSDPDPAALQLAALWGEVRGETLGPRVSYWQDFSFLHALAEAREAGMVIEDEHVVRSRTPETLAAALTAARARP